MNALLPLAAASAAALLLLAPMPQAHASAAVGQPAPGFTLTDTAGKAVSLADFKGRHVVLEWVNPGCPYVRKHYDSQNMQGTQGAAKAQGVVWMAINSTASDHGDYLAPAALQQWMNGHRAAATATLMDAKGEVGRAYGARTTPHMYVVDPAGKLVYAGAIDSKPTPRAADIATATNYVKQVLAEVGAGKPVSQPTTRPYGCSIKYADG